MIQTQPITTEFTIQPLNGNSFTVSIARAAAERVNDASSVHSISQQYGLDALKDAIAAHTGIDQVLQQLLGEERELTISDSLITLTTPITLVISELFSIELNSNVHALETREPFLFIPDVHLDLPNQCIIGYLHGSPARLRIRALGLCRNFFKIATADLPKGLKLTASPWSYSTSYSIPERNHAHVWLRNDTTGIQIV